MLTEKEDKKKAVVYYRLVSLWIISEAFAGGIMHGARIPFTGLLVSSLAVTCIILIAFYAPSRSGIIKATILVAMAKLALSPHSPPTAYLAVFFQGLLGQLLFRNNRHFLIKSIILAVLSLVESAIQRILVLVILYGETFWTAVNQFILKVTGSESQTDYTIRVAIAYILVHALAGLLIGVYASRLAIRAQTWKAMHPEWILGELAITEQVNSPRRKKRVRWKWAFALIWAFLFLSWIFPSWGMLPEGKAMSVLIRSVLIIAGWMLFISPLIMYVLRFWLGKQESKKKGELGYVMGLVPHTRAIFAECWKRSGRSGGMSRIHLFVKLLLVNLL